MKSKSAAAAGLCAWVINIIKFYEVFCDVEPKRKALAAANAELAAASEKLKSIKAQVAVSLFFKNMVIVYIGIKVGLHLINHLPVSFFCLITMAIFII